MWEAISQIYIPPHKRKQGVGNYKKRIQASLWSTVMTSPHRIIVALLPGDETKPHYRTGQMTRPFATSLRHERHGVSIQMLDQASTWVKTHDGTFLNQMTQPLATPLHHKRHGINIRMLN